MKKICEVGLCVSFATFAVMASFADTEVVEGIAWTYIVSNGEASVGGGSYEESTAVPKTTSGAITIPQTLGGKPVTTIGDYAFYDCSGLTSVTIPKSVKAIESNAFADCSGLTSVTIPDGVTSIGLGAFTGCTGLTSVTIPDSATSIEMAAFAGCSGLISVTIPAGVTYIDWCAFSGCSGLTSVTLPDSVTRICDWAFDGCSGLTSVSIPSSVTSIGDGAFAGCSGLTSVTVPGWQCGIPFDNVTNLVISEGTTNIVEGAFSGCGGLTSVTIPDGVTSIRMYAFLNCSGLASVLIPDSVTSIGFGAFYGCSGLTSVTIPDGVTSIGDRAFAGCSGLKDANGFVVLNGVLCGFFGDGGDVTIPDGVTSIEYGAFEDCIGLTSVTIPDGVTSIGDRAFAGCSGLTSVTIPDGVTSIGDGAFEDCIGLMSMTIPDSVTSISDWAFSNCGGLTSVTIPGSVTSIGDGAFYGCTGLTSVTIPNSVTSIGESAFYACSGLTSVYVSLGDADRIKGLMALSRSFISSASFIEVVRIVFDASGGSETETIRLVVSGNAVGELPKSTRNGYMFDGWWTAASGGSRVLASTKVAADVTYYAHWVEDAVLNPGEIDGAAPTTAASEYNGYLYDANSGAVKGTIQVKVGKPGKKDGKAAVKATVVLGAKKVTLKARNKGKTVINPSGPTEIELVGGEACAVVLGAEGLSGYYGAYSIDGARNFFASKSGGEVANAVLGKWLGAVNVIWNGGCVSVSMAKKGKVKVKGTLADGKTKVSAKSVLLVGEEWCAVPVAAPKANLAFTLWLSRDGRTAVVEGLGDGAIAGKPGALAANAAFHVSKTATLWSFIPGTVLKDYIPDGVKVTSIGGKWVLPKAGKVAFKNGGIDESKLGENPSGLKLSYKAKEGSFKGSFKVYAVNGAKAKATTVNVTGVMVKGVGYGTATVKGVGSVAVTIE